MKHVELYALRTIVAGYSQEATQAHEEIERLAHRALDGSLPEVDQKIEAIKEQARRGVLKAKALALENAAARLEGFLQIVEKDLNG